MKSTPRFKIGDRVIVRGLMHGTYEFQTFEGKQAVVHGVSKEGENFFIVDLLDGSASAGLTHMNAAFLRRVAHKDTFNKTYNRTLTEALRRIQSTRSKASLSVLTCRGTGEPRCAPRWMASLKADGRDQYNGFGKTPRAALRCLLKTIPAGNVPNDIHESIIRAASKRYQRDAGLVDITLRKIATQWSASIYAGSSWMLTRTGNTPKTALKSVYRAITEESEQ